MSDEFVNKHRDVAVAAMKAYWDAIAFWQKHPGRSRRDHGPGPQIREGRCRELSGPAAIVRQSLLWIYDYGEAAGFAVWLHHDRH